ncbi:MAG: hypothetical protein KAG99_08660, partial [Bacteroidales bacterium]|nr:hypothetical protein [Bacteroidales bacterium]
MRKLIIATLFLCLTTFFLVNAQEAELIRERYSKIEFKYDKIIGIGHENGCTRRDPSDVIKVGSTYYVYYTKVYGKSSGYWGTIWYAKSIDEGFSWNEEGEILG